MTTEEKRYIDLIDDVNSGEISIIDAKDILGDKYIRWLRAYNSYNEARKAYKEYQLALENYNKVLAKYNKAALNSKQAYNAYKEQQDTEQSVTKKHLLTIRIIHKALVDIGELENLADEELSRAVGTEFYEKYYSIGEWADTHGHSDVKIGVPHKITPEDRLANAILNKPIPTRDYIRFRPVWEDIQKQTAISHKRAKEYLNKFHIYVNANSELIEAGKLKDEAEVNYQDYTLLKIIGIL